MVNEQFEVFIPFACTVKLVVRDLLKKIENTYDMYKTDRGWCASIEKPIHDNCLYYYLVDDNFVLTDLVGTNNDIHSIPTYSEVRKKIKNSTYDLVIRHVNISKHLSTDNRPVVLSDRFNNLDNFIYVIYYYDKPQHDLNLKITLTKNNSILTMSDIQIKKNSSKILYTIEINEKLDTGDYCITLFNNKSPINDSYFFYKKLITYNNILDSCFYI